MCHLELLNLGINVGLLIGDEDVEVTGVLTALDCHVGR